MTTGWTTKEDFTNWDDVSTEPPPPLEPGLYHGLIVKAEAAQTKGGGQGSGSEPKAAVKLELQITHAHGGSAGELNRKMFDMVVLHRDTAFRVKQLALAAGVDLPASSGYEDTCAFAESLTGQTVALRSKLDSYTPPGQAVAKVNAKVDRYFTDEQIAEAAGGGGGEAPAAEARPARRRR